MDIWNLMNQSESDQVKCSLQIQYIDYFCKDDGTNKLTLFYQTVFETGVLEELYVFHPTLLLVCNRAATEAEKRLFFP